MWGAGGMSADMPRGERRQGQPKNGAAAGQRTEERGTRLFHGDLFLGEALPGELMT